MRGERPAEYVPTPEPRRGLDRCRHRRDLGMLERLDRDVGAEVRIDLGGNGRSRPAFRGASPYVAGDPGRTIVHWDLHSGRVGRGIAQTKLTAMGARSLWESRCRLRTPPLEPVALQLLTRRPSHAPRQERQRTTNIASRALPLPQFPSQTNKPRVASPVLTAGRAGIHPAVAATRGHPTSPPVRPATTNRPAHELRTPLPTSRDSLHHAPDAVTGPASG